MHFCTVVVYNKLILCVNLNNRSFQCVHYESAKFSSCRIGSCILESQRQHLDARTSLHQFLTSTARLHLHFNYSLQHYTSPATQLLQYSLLNIISMRTCKIYNKIIKIKRVVIELFIFFLINGSRQTFGTGGMQSFSKHFPYAT